MCEDEILGQPIDNRLSLKRLYNHILVNTKHELFYNLAYALAEIAFEKDEVPVGAVVFKDNTYELISSSYNQMKSNKSSIDHAENNRIKTCNE